MSSVAQDIQQRGVSHHQLSLMQELVREAAADIAQDQENGQMSPQGSGQAAGGLLFMLCCLLLLCITVIHSECFTQPEFRGIVS